MHQHCLSRYPTIKLPFLSWKCPAKFNQLVIYWKPFATVYSGTTRVLFELKAPGFFARSCDQLLFYHFPKSQRFSFFCLNCFSIRASFSRNMFFWQFVEYIKFRFPFIMHNQYFVLKAEETENLNLFFRKFESLWTTLFS